MVKVERPPLLARGYHHLREWLSPIGKFNRQLEQARQFALPSTVSIETAYSTNKLPRGQEVIGEVGAGYVVETIPAKGKKPAEVIIATNRHVVEDAVIHRGSLLKFNVVTSGADVQTGIQGEKKVFKGGEVVYISNKHDVAFVKLSLGEHPEVHMPALKLGYSELVDTPDTLISIGAPLGAEDTVTQLQLSQYNLTKVCVEGNCDFYRQISNANPGNSGGPVIDPMYAGKFGEKPRVVGMITVGTVGNSSQGYMLPIEVVKAELAEYHKREKEAGNKSSSDRRIVTRRQVAPFSTPAPKVA